MLGVADQVLSSVVNFGISIVAALSLSPAEFGAFAVVLISYSIIVPGLQAIVGQELVLATGSFRDRLLRSRDALLFSAILGTGAAICLVGAAALVPSVRSPLLVLAFALPVLQVQDTLRYAASVLDRMQLAVASDGLWLLTTAGGVMVAVSLSFEMTTSRLVGLWAAGGIVGAIVPLITGLFIARNLPRPTLARFRSRRYLGYRFIWEYAAIRGVSQALYIALGGLAGLVATGGLRGAISLFGPLTVVILAASSFGVPIIRTVGPKRRELILMACTASAVAVCAILTLVIMIAPPEVGVKILGETWSGAHSFAIPVGVQTGFTAISAALFLALRMVAPRSTLRLRLLPSALLPLTFFAGYFAAGAVGAVWGLCVAAGVQSVLALLAYLKLRVRGNGLASL